MSQLRDFKDFITDPLVLPIMGKNYTVPPLTARSGLHLALLAEKIDALASGSPNLDLEAFTDEGEEDLYRHALGTLYDELIDDDVPFTALRLAGMVAFVDAIRGRDYAVALWQSVGDAASGEAEAAPNRAARRSKTRSGKTGAAASSTKKRASGSGTRSRPKSSPDAPPEPQD